jgi:hypothetical protein
MSESFRERVARNQAAYRKVNEGIRAGQPTDADGPRQFVCECAILGCTELVTLTVQEYEGVRSSERCFVIAPGHEIPDAERTVSVAESGDLIVEKHSDLAPILHELNPRT